MLVAVGTSDADPSIGSAQAGEVGGDPFLMIARDNGDGDVELQGTFEVTLHSGTQLLLSDQREFPLQPPIDNRLSVLERRAEQFFEMSHRIEAPDRPQRIRPVGQRELLTVLAVDLGPGPKSRDLGIDQQTIEVEQESPYFRLRHGAKAIPMPGIASRRGLLTQ